jgi:Trypsin-co-occurring domain 2
VVAERVELAQVIGQLRQELSAAMREGAGENLRFELGTVELELTVAVSREAGPNAKVRFWVIELGADATVSSQATQRITLTLEPRHRGVAGKPLISGPEQAGER